MKATHFGLVSRESLALGLCLAPVMNQARTLTVALAMAGQRESQTGWLETVLSWIL